MAAAKTIVMPGGNSGIGLEAAGRLVEQGHHVVLLGRDRAKGAAAAAGLKGPGQAEFLAADLSTHAGVRAAAAELGRRYPRIDVLLHTTGVLMMQDARTADGLHPFFSVNYLSRYHLTQLLLPNLRAAAPGRVLMMTSKLPLDTRIDFSNYPQFTPFVFQKMTAPIQFGNLHYVAHLRDTEPQILAGALDAGVARTGIWRATPWYLKAFTTVVGPFFFDSVATSAVNPVALASGDPWPSGSWWPKPGKPEQRVALQLDPQETERVMAVARQLTGV